MTRRLTFTVQQRNAQAVARQNWRLARQHYDEVCRAFNPLIPEDIQRFQAAVDRRMKAFERYMSAMMAEE